MNPLQILSKPLARPPYSSRLANSATLGLPLFTCLLGACIHLQGPALALGPAVAGCVLLSQTDKQAQHRIWWQLERVVAEHLLLGWYLLCCLALISGQVVEAWAFARTLAIGLAPPLHFILEPSLAGNSAGMNLINWAVAGLGIATYWYVLVWCGVVAVPHLLRKRGRPSLPPAIAQAKGLLATLVKDPMLHALYRNGFILARQWFLPSLCTMVYFWGVINSGGTYGLSLLPAAAAYVLGIAIKCRHVQRINSELRLLERDLSMKYKTWHMLLCLPLLQMALFLANLITYALQWLGFLALVPMLLGLIASCIDLF